MFKITLLLTLFLHQSFAISNKEVPLTAPGAQTVSVQQAHNMLEKNKADFAIVDVRLKIDFIEGRLPGAILVSYPDNFVPTEFNKLKVGNILVYCSGATCFKVYNAISALHKAHTGKKIYWMRDGFFAWKRAGFPIEIGSPDKP